MIEKANFLQAKNRIRETFILQSIIQVVVFTDEQPVVVTNNYTIMKIFPLSTVKQKLLKFIRKVFMKKICVFSDLLFVIMLHTTMSMLSMLLCDSSSFSFHIYVLGKRGLSFDFTFLFSFSSHV